MGPLQQVGFRFTQQFTRFGFQSLGQVATGTSRTAPFQQLVYFDFTKQFAQFRSRGLATSAGPTPPGTGVDQFLVAGPDITEQFVTFGGISAMGLSYIINPLSRKTVGGTAAPSPPSAPVNVTPPVVAPDGIFPFDTLLTATPGVYTGSPAPVLTGQWFHGNFAGPPGSECPGATGPTLVASFDFGDIQFFWYEETATNASGSIVTDSNVVGPSH